MTTPVTLKPQSPHPKTISKATSPTLVLLFTLLALMLGVVPTDAQTGTVPDEKASDVVVALVNGQQIMKSQIDMRAAVYKKKTGKPQMSNDEMTELVKSVVRRHLILSLPEVETFRNDPQVIAQLQEYENQIIIGKYLSLNIAPSLNVSEQQMKDYYKQNRHEFSTQPSVEARHILLRSKEEAQKVLKELKAGGDFGELAKKYSIDLPRALEGGSMGVIQKGGRVHPDLEKALFFLAEGEISVVTKTQFGYHILIVDKIQPAGFKTFDEVRPQIRKALMRKNEAQAFNTMAEKLEKNADVTIYKELLQTGPSS